MRVVKLHPNAQISTPKHGDAGYDLFTVENVVLTRKHALIGTGISMEIPEGWVGLLTGRSSYSAKGVNFKLGVIDSTYRGEIKIMAYVDEESMRIEAGTKIAQIVIVPHFNEKIEYVDKLSETARGHGGFGSTGDK